MNSTSSTVRRACDVVASFSVIFAAGNFLEQEVGEPGRFEVGWDGELPVVSKAAPAPVTFAESEPLRNECEAFLGAIDGTAHPPSNAAEGIRVLKVLAACQQSILQGRPMELEAP